MRAFFLSSLLVLLVSCGPPKAIEANDLVKDLSSNVGKRITVRGKFRSGARCRQGEDGEWKTYCKDCQYCRGPVVLDAGNVKTTTTSSVAIDDWPVVLGGTWEGKDIRCKGPLGKIECYPFLEGKTYVVQGKLEHHRPAKLLVEKFWEVD